MNTLTSRHKTIVYLVYPPSTAAKRFLLTLAGAAFVAVMAQLSFRLPFSPVPLTGQTLAVLLLGAALGSRLGFRSLAVYLAAGAAGLPVFAGGGAGPAWLLGPSAGYLLAFPFAAWLVGFLVERYGSDRRPIPALAAMLAASGVIYLAGMAWLAVFLTVGGQTPHLGRLLFIGCYPFVPGDLLKAVLASALLPGAWKAAAAFGKM